MAKTSSSKSTELTSSYPNGFKFVKMPRNISEYTLMKGVTDFSNVKQFDLFETGYSFLTVVSVPKFMQVLATKYSDTVGALQDGFIHILEGEFKGLSGLPSLEGQAGEISNGANSIQLLNNVNMDTSIQISMSFYERSGSLISKYLEYYLTGIKDPYSKAKTYHGLIGEEITDPGADWEVFTLLYYVTDNTMRSIEKAYLLCNCQPTSSPQTELYESTKGTYDFPEVQVQMNCFPIVGDKVNEYATIMLQNDLTTDVASRKLVLDSSKYNFNIYNKIALSDINKDTSISSTEYSGLGNKVGTILSDTTVRAAAQNRLSEKRQLGVKDQR